MNAKLREPICPCNPLVFLDITIGKEFAGRMVIELRKDVVPKTAENFRALCTGERGIGQMGKPLHYKGTRFHKITRLFVAQAGDILHDDGTGGESIYGPVFEDENFDLEHEDGVVSMANYGEPDSNNSQFVITSIACVNLNGTNVVFGRVLRGFGIVADMEQNTTDDSEPTQDIIITDCGEIPAGQDWGNVDKDDSLPPYPEDWELKFNEFTIEQILDILVGIRKTGNEFFRKEFYFDARRKYRKAERYYNMMRKRADWQELNHLKIDDDDLHKLDSFSAVNNSNMAAVELKLNEYDKARLSCSEAIRLDKNCGKAYFRRGQAEIALANYENAIKDLTEAHKLLPNEKLIIAELTRGKNLLIEYNRKQSNAYKKLFI